MAESVKVVTGKAFIAHPYIFNPRPESAEIDPGKFTVMVGVPKSDTDTVKRIKDAIAEAIKRQWPEGKTPGGMSMPLKDGDAKFAEDEKKYSHMKGHYYLNAKTTTKPKVFDATVVALPGPTDEVVLGLGALLKGLAEADTGKTALAERIASVLRARLQEKVQVGHHAHHH